MLAVKVHVLDGPSLEDSVGAGISRETIGSGSGSTSSAGMPVPARLQRFWTIALVLAGESRLVAPHT